MKILQLISIIIVLSTSFSYTQEVIDSTKISWQYFGLKPPGTNPEIFASGIISTNEFEFGGTFSKDMKEYFFTRRPTYEGNANRIYYSQFTDDKWTIPVLAPFAKDIFEFEPVMSPNKDKLYFYSERKEMRNAQFDGDIWVTEKTTNGWNKPVHFASPINKKWCMSVCPSLANTLFFTSSYNGKRGIFKAKNQNGEYPAVEFLDDNINSTYFSHPFIAPDESYIIMDAQLSGRGKPELFISYKKKDNSWTNPINMGTTINATKTEFGASVSPDGKCLFFHRRVNGKGDIYWVSTKIIEQIAEENKINLEQRK